MRIYLMTDLEGVAVMDRQYVLFDSRYYEREELLTEEVNAAIEVFEAGWHSCSDGHGYGGINQLLLDPG